MGAVVIIVAAHDQHGNLDLGEFLFEVERRKGGVEPSVIPPPKCDIDVGVVARETLAQFAFEKSGARPSDFRKRLRLDDHMRRHQHEAADPRIKVSPV